MLDHEWQIAERAGPRGAAEVSARAGRASESILDSISQQGKLDAALKHAIEVAALQAA
jgi:hypothetical protein